jgi:4-hydroxybenzoate polyprenyltransferase
VLLAVLLSQLAIGWHNDYLDRESDAVHQPSKPVPAGLVEARQMPAAIGLALAGCIATGVVLGVETLPPLAGGCATGLAYNAWLKGTRLSPLPYVVAFALLPVFVWTALDSYRDELLALYAVATPFTLAAHVANTLPDIVADATAGRRTLTVVLGRERSLLLLAASMLAPMGLVALTLPWIDYDLSVLNPGLPIYAVLLITAGLAYRKRQDSAGFQLVVAAAVVFVARWLAAV